MTEDNTPDLNREDDARETPAEGQTDIQDDTSEQIVPETVDESAIDGWTDLWGELPLPADVDLPNRILAEQAQILSVRTRHTLVGEVRSTRLGDEITYELIIIAPLLNNYQVMIAKVRYAILFVYPARLSSPYTEAPPYGSILCNSATELREALGRILQSSKVRQILSSLLAQSIP